MPPAVSDLNGIGPEVVPIVTRAWAHDDFGRMVFDWPWAVAYGARIEGKTLTVMFDRRLHTTFQQIPRNLGSYITDVEIGPDGQSVVVSLTNEYRLRTFLLNNEDGGVKVVVDLLADGEAGPVLAQAPTPPIPEPSPEAVPGDAHPPPHISGDAPLPLAEAAPETPPTDLPPGLPFAVEADAPPEDAPESFPPERGAEEHPLLGGVPRQRRGGSTDAPPSSSDPNGEQTTEQSAGQAAVPPLETATETAGADPPRPSATPPERGSEAATSPVTADADTPPVEPDSPPESAQTAEALHLRLRQPQSPSQTRSSHPRVHLRLKPPSRPRPKRHPKRLLLLIRTQLPSRLLKPQLRLHLRLNRYLKPLLNHPLLGGVPRSGGVGLRTPRLLPLTRTRNRQLDRAQTKRRFPYWKRQLSGPRETHPGLRPPLPRGERRKLLRL